MIKSVDPRLPSDVLFLLWTMGHGDEVAVVHSRYVTAQAGDIGVRGVVARMDDCDTPQAVRAILSALQLDTTFVAHPVRQIENRRSSPPCEVQRAVQDEVDRALGFSCEIEGVAGPQFREQVENCSGLIVTGDVRRRGVFIFRKGLDVIPDAALSAEGWRRR
jgi:L-fucose mutarotase